MTDSAFRIDAKVALVTGASSGLGYQQALALSAAGAQVVAIGRRASRLDSLVDEIQKKGGTAAAIAADLLPRERLPAIVDQAFEAFGRIDIVVNSAGVNLRQSVDDITLESWDQTLNLNLAVPFFLARACVDDMRKRGWGRIINMASLQSSRAFANGLAYGASKGGISQLTRAMSEAWSAQGITCNAMAPGFFPTELTAPLFDDVQARSGLASQTTIGRNGEMQDIDGLTVFLASPASDYITGQVIHIDGGFTAR